jgi:hypothetical protein
MDNLNSIWDQLTVISSRTVTPSELTTEAVTVRIWSTSRSRCPPPSSPEIISAFLSHLNLGKEILPNFSSTAPRLSISLKIPSDDLPRLLSAPARFQIPGKGNFAFSTSFARYWKITFHPLMHPDFVARAPNEDIQRALTILGAPNSLVAWGAPMRSGSNPAQRSGTAIALYSVCPPFASDSPCGYHQKDGWWIAWTTEPRLLHHVFPLNQIPQANPPMLTSFEDHSVVRQLEPTSAASLPLRTFILHC